MDALNRAANEGRNVLPDATDDQAAVIEAAALAALERFDKANRDFKRAMRNFKIALALFAGSVVIFLIVVVLRWQ